MQTTTDFPIFAIEPDSLNKNRYIITVLIIIYRAEFGCYPEFLKSFDTPRAAKEGYDTKFWFLVPEAENLTLSQARDLLDKYNNDYYDLIRNCENTSNWDDYPFKNAELIYHK